MTIKTGILAAAAALTLAIPAAALAQPSYGHGQSYGYDRPTYGQSYGYDRRDGYSRFDRQREIRRQQELRRLRWEREHSYRYGYDRYGR